MDAMTATGERPATAPPPGRVRPVPARPSERLRIVRCRGAAARPVDVDVSIRDLRLARSDTIELLDAAQLRLGPGTVFATLTPSKPSVANKAALVFERARIVEGGQGWAAWRLWTGDHPELTQAEGEGEKALFIWMRSEAAGRRYLVDCMVSGGGPSDLGTSVDITHTFHVTGPAAFDQSTALPHGGGHVMFVLEAQDDGWYGFSLRSVPSWTFWFCEITRIE